MWIHEVIIDCHPEFPPGRFALTRFDPRQFAHRSPRPVEFDPPGVDERHLPRIVREVLFGGLRDISAETSTPPRFDSDTNSGTSPVAETDHHFDVTVLAAIDECTLRITRVASRTGSEQLRLHESHPGQADSQTLGDEAETRLRQLLGDHAATWFDALRSPDLPAVDTPPLTTAPESNRIDHSHPGDPHIGLPHARFLPTVDHNSRAVHNDRSAPAAAIPDSSHPNSLNRKTHYLALLKELAATWDTLRPKTEAPRAPAVDENSQIASWSARLADLRERQAGLQHDLKGYLLLERVAGPFCRMTELEAQLRALPHRPPFPRDGLERLHTLDLAIEELQQSYTAAKEAWRDAVRQTSVRPSTVTSATRVLPAASPDAPPNPSVPQTPSSSSELHDSTESRADLTAGAAPREASGSPSRSATAPGGPLTNWVAGLARACFDRQRQLEQLVAERDRLRQQLARYCERQTLEPADLRAFSPELSLHQPLRVLRKLKCDWDHATKRQRLAQRRFDRIEQAIQKARSQARDAHKSGDGKPLDGALLQVRLELRLAQTRLRKLQRAAAQRSPGDTSSTPSPTSRVTDAGRLAKQISTLKQKRALYETALAAEREVVRLTPRLVLLHERLRVATLSQRAFEKEWQRRVQRLGAEPSLAPPRLLSQLRAAHHSARLTALEDRLKDVQHELHRDQQLLAVVGESEGSRLSPQQWCALWADAMRSANSLRKTRAEDACESAAHRVTSPQPGQGGDTPRDERHHAFTATTLPLDAPPSAPPSSPNPHQPARAGHVSRSRRLALRDAYQQAKSQFETARRDRLALLAEVGADTRKEFEQHFRDSQQRRLLETELDAAREELFDAQRGAEEFALVPDDLWNFNADENDDAIEALQTELDALTNESDSISKQLAALSMPSAPHPSQTPRPTVIARVISWLARMLDPETIALPEPDQATTLSDWLATLFPTESEPTNLPTGATPFAARHLAEWSLALRLAIVEELVLAGVRVPLFVSANELPLLLRDNFRASSLDETAHAEEETSGAPIAAHLLSEPVSIAVPRVQPYCEQ